MTVTFLPWYKHLYEKNCGVKETLENSEGAIKTWTIQRNWQHRVYKTKKNKTKTQYNMCWTPLFAIKHTYVNKTGVLQ
jgi:hypothetical protein